MTDGGDQECQPFKRTQKRSEWRIGVRIGRWQIVCSRVRIESPDAHEEVERRLYDVDDVAEIVIGNESVIGGATRDEEVDKLVYLVR